MPDGGLARVRDWPRESIVLVVAGQVWNIGNVDVRRHPQVAIVREVLVVESRKLFPLREAERTEWHFVWPRLAWFQTAQALVDVAPKALPAVLAIAGDVDADLGLLAHDVLDA